MIDGRLSLIDLYLLTGVFYTFVMWLQARVEGKHLDLVWAPLVVVTWGLHPVVCLALAWLDRKEKRR